MSSEKKLEYVTYIDGRVKTFCTQVDPWVYRVEYDGTTKVLNIFSDDNLQVLQVANVIQVRFEDYISVEETLNSFAYKLGV